MNILTSADRARALARPGVTEADIDRYLALLGERMESPVPATREQARQLADLAVKLGFLSPRAAG